MTANGVLNFYKPTGMTSQTAVNIVKHIYGVKKAGHCGTLDPDASGVLPIMLGNAVKISEYLTDHDKTYRAKLCLGYETDTGDVSGNKTLCFEGELPSIEILKRAALSFVGGYNQLPPMYSALKVNGKKLVDLARQGKEIERASRRINIYSAELYEKDGSIVLDVSCSRGTYIRTLCEDIAKKAGCLGCMEALERRICGSFSCENAVSLESLRSMDESTLLSSLIPTDEALPFMPKLCLTPFFESLIKNGCCVDVRKLGLDRHDQLQEYRLYGENGFFGIGKIVLSDGAVCLKHKKLML